jgi:hypothetical protein
MSRRKPETKASELARAYYNKPGVRKIHEYLALNPGKTVNDYADGLVIALRLEDDPLSAWLRREFVKLAERDLQQ